MKKYRSTMDSRLARLAVPVVAINPRKNKGLLQLKKVLIQTAHHRYRPPSRDFLNVKALAENAIGDFQKVFPSCREIFVGTMATLYSVEADNKNTSLRQKMSSAVRHDGTKIYTLATGISLMVFYVLAMHEHAGCSKKRNKNLEMAFSSIILHDFSCIYNGAACIKTLQMLLSAIKVL